jgi:oligopeptide transport system ATP-binding protein
MSLLEVRDLTKHFALGGLLDRLMSGKRSIVRAVDGVSLHLEAGETLGLVGESGSGKSTLGRTLVRLYKPTSGSIRFQDTDISRLSSGQMRPLRRQVQMIFQDPIASLNPQRTVAEIVAAPLRVHRIPGDHKARLEELLESVGLRAAHAQRFSYQLSGGQAQRVGIARALAVDPQLIIADEPVSSLDVSVQAQIINLMKRLQQERGLSYVFIAHNLAVVRHIADRTAVMYLGKLAETASTDRLFQNPLHPYTQALLSAIPRVHPERRRERIILPGSPPSPIDPPSGCPFQTRCHRKIGEICEREMPPIVQVEPGHEVACHLYPAASFPLASTVDREAAPARN